MQVFNLTYTQARRLATAAAVRIYSIDEGRPADWTTAPTQCKLTQSDQRYRAELENAYDAIMSQLHSQQVTA